MSKITAIKPQKNQKRVNVYLDEKFAFGLDLENFVKLNLKVGQELNQKEVTLIIRKSEFQKYLNKVIDYAMVRPRSAKEIIDYFNRKKISKNIQNKLLKKLKKFKLIDDAKFAKWWVEQRLAFRSKSQRVMDHELRSKGVSNEIISNILENAKIDEVKIAKKLVSKKFYKWQKYDEKTRKQKISQYLTIRGFNWDVIEKVV